VLQHLTGQPRANGIELQVAHMKQQRMDTLRRTNVIAEIGEDRFTSRIHFALQSVGHGPGPEYERNACPLRNPDQ
jgi:hypothetical protein